MRTPRAIAALETRGSGPTSGITDQSARARRLLRNLKLLECAVETPVDAFATMRLRLAETDRTVR